MRRKSSRERKPFCHLSRDVNRDHSCSIWPAVNPVSEEISMMSSCVRGRDDFELPILEFTARNDVKISPRICSFFLQNLEGYVSCCLFYLTGFLSVLKIKTDRLDP